MQKPRTFPGRGFVHAGIAHTPGMVRVVIPADEPDGPAYGGRTGQAAVSRMGYQRQRSGQSSQASMNTILAALEKGFSITDACRAAQRSRSAYQYYRDNFPEWRDRV